MDQKELAELLEKSRESAKAYVDKKEGRGLLIYKGPDEMIDTVLFGGDSEMSQSPQEKAQSEMDLILSLMLTYLPGSSVEYKATHDEVMDGLRALNGNVLNLFEFLKAAFPGVKIQGVKQGKHSDSGLILG